MPESLWLLDVCVDIWVLALPSYSHSLNTDPLQTLAAAPNNIPAKDRTVYQGFLREFAKCEFQKP